MGLYQIYHPSVFQGTKRANNYFEGWYFKHVSRNYDQVLSIIPGVSITSKSLAFIQLIDGITGQTHFIEYPVEDFSASSKIFDVWIGKNHFSSDGIYLDIDSDTIKLKGELIYKNRIEWPIKLWSPGIMGWYRFVPYMECYHGVVSVNHSVEGELTGTKNPYIFDGGSGYIEKDWGSSMPEQWIWLHANCFPENDTVLMISVAKIPWRGKFFVGFLGFLAIGSKIYKFFTYNRSKIFNAELQGNNLNLTLANSKFTLAIAAIRKTSGELKAPLRGKMDRYIKESIDSEVSFELTDNKGLMLASGKSAQAGLEIVGDVISLL